MNLPPMTREEIRVGLGLHPTRNINLNRVPIIPEFETFRQRWDRIHEDKAAGIIDGNEAIRRFRALNEDVRKWMEANRSEARIAADGMMKQFRSDYRQSLADRALRRVERFAARWPVSCFAAFIVAFVAASIFAAGGVAELINLYLSLRF